MSHEPQFFLPSELVARALASLADECHTQIDLLLDQPKQGDPSVKGERAFWLAQYRAFVKAAWHWGNGVRPVAITDGWIVPSGTRAGMVHEIRRAGGVWQCGPSCEAKSFHWHTALVLGIEKAGEMAAAEDDGDAELISPDDYEPEPDIVGDDIHLPPPPAELGRRLCAARSKYLAAA